LKPPLVTKVFNLDYTAKIHNKRKAITNRFNESYKILKAESQSGIQFKKTNYAYYPLIFVSGQAVLKLMKFLKKRNIHAAIFLFILSKHTTLPRTY